MAAGLLGFAPSWRLVVVSTALLIVGMGGCRVPPLPGNVDAAEYNKPVPDSWLFRGLTGRGSESESGSGQAATNQPASGVVQASADLPAPDAHTTILPPAGPELDKIEAEDSGFDWEDLWPSNVYKNLKNSIGLGPDEQIARAAYREGEELYVQQKYKEAAEKFATAAKRWPDSLLEEDALFFLAECYFFTDQYTKANDTYQNLLKKHSFSRHLDKVVARLFAIGRYWEQSQVAQPHWPVTPNLTDNSRPLFDTFGHALKTYEQIRLNDPTGPLADDAVMATANAYFLTQRYEDAAYHYDLIRKEYPKSEHQVNAHVLAVKSKLEVYQGASYDGTPLEEAGEVAQTALSQFPEQLGSEKELMVKTKNAIVEQKAERDWAIAEYYDKKKYYGAARFYYDAIIKDYPQTRFAQMARARLAEIKDLPSEPANHFQFLTEKFSSKEEIIPESTTKTVNIDP
ncbi:MAG: outer membrane protein assembly factor BamD [Rhodopirellula sp.]|nr:outer membrane protein assembly factor BamD [Rhodopirellula sp.]